MSFIISLSEYVGFNGVFTCADKLTKLTKVLPCYVGEEELSAPETTKYFFDNMVYLYGFLQLVLYDRDILFTN